MKAVLIATQPQHCKNIKKGIKGVEVRKSRPKLETPFKVYIYMTKAYDTLFGYGKPKKLCVEGRKVIGEFVCDRIDEYCYGVYEGEFCYHIPTVEVEKTCLDYTEVEEYGNGKPLYFWYISNLIIYDKPKELIEFGTFCKSYYDGDRCDDCKYFIDGRGYDYDESDCGCNGLKPIERPPQSWCYVEKRSDTN